MAEHLGSPQHGTQELKLLGCILYGDPTKYSCPPSICGIDSNMQEEVFAIGVSKRVKVG